METQLNISPLKNWMLSEQQPLIIAGPCSAETQEQVIKTARELAAQNIKVFRAGIWKPRTRPDNFEGVGTQGLEWLQQVKRDTGMLTCTEVVNVKHVYEALKYGIDILWIGARTTVNPFVVQEIADAIKGVDIPILIKNPVNTDLNLWLGAIERFNKTGITKIGAVHRGFTSYEKSIYRNPPKWNLVIELKRKIPDLPVICDPSHMGGKKSLLQELMQKAIDLNYDGLMIESHIHPENALSDSSQQLTPDELNYLLQKIILRSTTSANPVFLEILEELRMQIDKLDNELVEILERRMHVADTIGEYKRRNNITILQSKRWDEIFKKHIESGIQKGLSAEFMQKLLNAIHQESIDHQARVMNFVPATEISEAVFKW